MAGCHWQRVETGGTGQGIPDTNACWQGREFWLELKIVKGRRILLEPEQVGWHVRRALAGGQTWILACHTGKGIYAGKGVDAREIKDQGIDCPVLVFFSYPVQWAALRDFIAAP